MPNKARADSNDAETESLERSNVRTGAFNNN